MPAAADKPGGQCYNSSGGFAPDAAQNVSGWLAGYALGVSDGPLPYPNTLASAIEYCCRADVAPGCGGVTLATNTNWSFARYEARAAAGALNPLPLHSSIRTWLKQAGGVATPFFVSGCRCRYHRFRSLVPAHESVPATLCLVECSCGVAEHKTYNDRADNTIVLDLCRRMRH